ncbi:MAG: response regulator [Planctomycetota bacterium]
MTRPFSVLLVEDDDPLRAVLFELLRQRGWHVHTASRGDEAVEMARRVEIDFSILDLHLPGLNGLEVYRRICAEIRPLPSILMSGEASGEEARRALELGMVEFLRKPLELDRLRRALDELVRRTAAGFPADPPHGDPARSLPVRLDDLWPRPPRRRRR